MCHKKVDNRYVYQVCPEEEACTSYKGHFIVDNQGFVSIIDKFKLYCSKRDLLKIMKNMIVFFSTVSCLIFGFISDAIGRRGVIFVAVILALIGFILSFFSKEFTLMIIGNCFLLGFFHINVMVIYLYSNEIFDENLRSKSIGLLFMSYSFGQIIFFMVYSFLKQYQYVYLVQIVPVLFFLPIVRFLRESPYFLARTKKFRQLSKVLKKIALTNYKNNLVVH
jgi:MFS family permease